MQLVEQVDQARRTVAGRASLVLLLHAAECGAFALAGAVVVDGGPGLFLVAATALVASAVLPGIVGRSTAHVEAAAVGVAWFATSLVHHLAVGMSGRWRDEPLGSTGHAVWDVAFHLPAVVCVAWALGGAAPAAR